ncbi:MAG: BlaI/MecI/CopY family transcriptional regulator [Brevinematales bacterium]|jgi:predicted transcriptional regulator
MEQKRIFGELELKVMNVLWEKKEASVYEVQNSIGMDVAYTTILTVLSRMFAKGMVDRSKAGKNYVYSIKVEKSQAISSMLDKIKKSIFGGKSFQMVNYLIDNADDIHDEELVLISNLIEKRKKELKRE